MLLNFFTKILVYSINGTILAIIILIAKKFFNKTFDAKFQYLIWLLLIFKLLFFIDIESPFSIYSVTDKIIENISENTLTPYTGIILNQIDGISSKPIPAKTYGILKILGLVWLLGLVCLLSIFISSMVKINDRKYSMLLYDDEKIETIFKRTVKNLNLKKSPDLFLSLNGDLPFTFGIINPAIVVPDMENFSEKEIEFILMHELIHIKNKDSLFKLLGISVSIIYWFNPIIWYFFIALQRECEYSCDEALIKNIDKKNYRNYCKSIITLAEYSIISRELSLNSYFAGEKKQLETRLFKILNFNNLSTVKLIVSSILIFFIFFIGIPNPISKVFSQNYLELAKYLDYSAEDLIEEFGSNYELLDVQGNEYVKTLRYHFDDIKVDFTVFVDYDHHMLDISTNSYGGISVGFSKDNLVKLMGQPNEFRENSDWLFYNYNEDRYFIMFSIEKETMLIENIYISKYEIE